MGPAIEDDDDPDGMPRVHGPIDEVTGRPRKFAYPPNLVVVDGGLPQVNAAQRVLEELGIEDVSLVGLAKRLEEVWVPGQDFPLILPRTSEGLYLLQRVRDEAHRFAITFHRQRRSKAMTTSGARRHPGSGRRPAQGAAARSSGRSSGSAPRRPRRSPPCRASGRSWPRPSRRGWPPRLVCGRPGR